MNRDTLLVAALQAGAGGAALASAEGDPSLFDTPRSIGLYVAGSVAGALLTMLAFPQVEPSIELQVSDPRQYDRLKKRDFQRLCAKGSASLLGGIAFTPILMEWFGVGLTENRILAFSAVVAMFVVSAIHIVSPKLEKLIDAWSDNLASRHKPPKDEP